MAAPQDFCGMQVPVSAAPTLRREYRFVWTRNLTGGSAGALVGLLPPWDRD